MKGTIEIYEVIAGEWRYLATMANSVLYGGYDAMTRAAAGDSAYAINGMYVEYTNATPVEPVIPLTRDYTYYRDLAAPFGFVRMKTVSAPVYTTSDASKYKSNVATFMGVTDGTSAGGAPVIAGTTRFISLSLVAIPNLGEVSLDKVVSAAPIKEAGVFAPKLKMANSQMGFKWSLRLG